MAHIPIGFSTPSAIGAGFTPHSRTQAPLFNPGLEQERIQAASAETLARIAAESRGDITDTIFGGGGALGGLFGGAGGGKLNPLGGSLSSSLGISLAPTAEFGGLRQNAIDAQPAGGVALPGATGVPNPGAESQGILSQLAGQNARDSEFGQGGFGLASTDKIGLADRLQNDALRGANVATQGVLTRQRGQGIREQTGNQQAGLGLAKNLFQRLA